jgi:hypothetical protein
MGSAYTNGQVKQTKFNNYRNIDGLPVPFEINTRIDGQLYSRIQVESVTLNPGVLSSLFDVPEALRNKEEGNPQ